MLKERLVDSLPLDPKGVDKAVTKVNFFIGNDRSRWKSNVPSYNEIRFGEIYKGISLKLRAYGNNVEKIFTVNPGSSPEEIKLAIERGLSLNINKEGELEVKTGLGRVKFSAPIAYQLKLHDLKPQRNMKIPLNPPFQKGELLEYFLFQKGELFKCFPFQKGEGQFLPFCKGESEGISLTNPGKSTEVVREYVKVAYNLTKNGYGFIVDNYDRKRPLIIDPMLASTFIGGSGDDLGYDLTLDSSGNVYVAGRTTSNDYPTTSGVTDETYNGNDDFFISKLNSDLTSFLVSTFLGGSNDDWESGIALDSLGNVYVCGMTLSGNYPTTGLAYDTTYGGGWDSVISKLDSNLTTLLASTFIGKTNDDAATSLALNSSGETIYITGKNFSGNYPVTPGAYDITFNGSNDVVVSALDKNLTKLYASTYIGGSSGEVGYAVLLDNSGNVYVFSDSQSNNYPTTGGAYDTTHNGGWDIVITKLKSDLSGPLLASTYIGGSSTDKTGSNSVFDVSGSTIYLTGYTASANYPTTPGAYDTAHNGSYDVVVSALDSNLTTLYTSTFIGGGSTEESHSLVLDSAGNVYVTGYTGSNDYPTTAGAYDTTHNGSNDIFISKLDSNLSNLLASTFIGGSGNDNNYAAYGIVLDSSGNVYVTGQTASADFPTMAGAYDEGHNGSVDVFVSKLTADLLAGVNSPPAAPTAISPADEAIVGVVSGVSLVSSAFSDPESDTHVRTHWLIKRADRVYMCGDYDASFDHVANPSGLTEHTVNGLAAGLKYVWKVGYVDSGSEVTSWSKEYAFKVGTSQADSNVSIPSGTAAASYIMKSFFQWPDNPDSMSVFGDEMGGSYDRNNYRIGHYDADNSGYHECGSEDVEPGAAWWCLARNGLDITVNGISVSMAHNIEVDLDYNTSKGYGWNQVGCPNDADYFWGNVEVLEYNADGQIVYGPTAVSDLTDPNPYIDKRLWGWENGSYNSNTTWMKKYEGYWVKAKKANVYLKFKVSAQASLSNPGTMLAGLFSEWKNRIKGWVPSPNDAIADDGDSPPGPPGDFSVIASGGDNPGGGGGSGSSSGSGIDDAGGGVGGGAGCFISTLTSQ